jgi:hypothetical protein
MKKLICLVIIFISFGVFLDGCKEDDPTAQAITTDALINDSKAWTIAGGTVTLDGGDVTDSFSNFQITFTGTTYSSSGGGDVWPDATNAAWTYDGTDVADASTIIPASQVEVQIVVTKGSQLSLTFTVTDAGARRNGLSGNYTFELKSGA